MGERRASHGKQCPSYSLCWAPCARRSEPALRRSRTWRSGNNLPCSAATRSDRRSGASSSLLGVALHPVGWVARGAPRRAPRDCHSLAPAGLPCFLDLEVPARANGSTAGRLGACGSRAHHGAGESALGRATHPRRVAQTRARRLAAHCCPAHAASPETTFSDLANVPSEPPRRPRLRRLLRRTDRDLPGALRVRGPAASSPSVIHFNVTDSPTAAWTAQQIVEVFPDDSAPRYLLRDRDSISAASFGDG